MPALVDQPQILKAEFRFNLDTDSDVSTRMYFKYTGTAPSNATCLALAAELHAAWNNAWLGHLFGSRSIVGVTLTDLTTPTSGYAIETSSNSGTATGDMLPAACCLLMNCSIARRYRGGKPRMYWPILVAADLVNAQTFDPSVLATAKTEWDTSFLGAVIGFTSGGTTIAEWVNVSYYEGFTAVLNPITGRYKNVNKPRTVAIAPDPIISYGLNQKPGTQRRRQLHSS